MVFAVRCPAAPCRKYMLVEDTDRGTTVGCLICKAPIKVPAATGGPAPAPAAAPAPAPPKPAPQKSSASVAIPSPMALEPTPPPFVPAVNLNAIPSPTTKLDDFNSFITEPFITLEPDDEPVVSLEPDDTLNLNPDPAPPAAPVKPPPAAPVAQKLPPAGVPVARKLPPKS